MWTYPHDKEIQNRYLKVSEVSVIGQDYVRFLALWETGW